MRTMIGCHDSKLCVARARPHYLLLLVFGGGAGYRGVKSLFFVFPSLIREVGRLTSFFRFHLKIAKFSPRREFDIATIRL